MSEESKHTGLLEAIDIIVNRKTLDGERLAISICLIKHEQGYIEHLQTAIAAQAKEIERLKKIESSLEAWLEAVQSVDPKEGILVTALKRTLTGE